MRIDREDTGDVKQKTRKTVSSPLLRGLSILKCFNETNEALSVTDIARMTGIPQPTVWRFCQTFRSGGYLTTDADKTRFRPGLALLGLGFAAISHFNPSDHARRYLVELAGRFKVVAGLTSREGLRMRIVDRHQDADAVLSYNSRIGATLPMATTASGWAYLASLDAAGRVRLIAEIAREQPDLWKMALPAFNKALARYQREGVIVSAGPIERGLTTVAVPIASPGSAAIYPLYCSAISSALPAELIKRELAPMMKKVAEELRVVLPAM
jgi:DNA-binding IclR family transcriptional regulator